MSANDRAREVGWRLGWRVRFGCWALLVAACSAGGRSGDGGSDGSVAPNADAGTETCEALAEAVKAYYQSCRPTDPITSAIARRFATECKIVAGAPGLSGFGAALSACRSAYASATPTCATVDPAPCLPPEGALANGAVCGADAQCASRFCSVPDGGNEASASYFAFAKAKNASPALGTTLGACGVCAPCTGACRSGLVCQLGRCIPSPLSRLGESCVDRPCENGLQCDLPYLTCGVPIREGESCVLETYFERGCAPPLVCQRDATGIMGTCVQGAPEGGDCGSPNRACARGLLCDPSGTCSSAPTIPTAGQTCGVNRPCETGLCGPLAPTSAPTTCPVPIPDGQACDPNEQRAYFAPCNYFSQCQAGICVLFDPSSC